MTLSHLVAVLTALSLNANPSSHAIPVKVDVSPIQPQTVLPTAPAKKNPQSLGIDVTAKSAVVVDVASGAVLFSKDSTVQRPIASITKLMTAMVVLDQGLRPDELMTLELGDFEETSQFQAQDTLTRKDAFRAMLIGSVNEIANGFARTSPGGRAAFLEAMRQKAETLGLSKAVFEDASGVNSGSRASAVDVAIMMRSALAYPEIREATETNGALFKTTAGRSVNVKSTNLLLSSFLNKDSYKIVAGKTGSLPQAGFCLAQTTQNADGHQIITVGLGSVDHFSRFQDVKALTAWSFDNYEWK
jgi:D-alanyl-D-alanine endopeptidase (penicillin-binding protein 7)